MNVGAAYIVSRSLSTSGGGGPGKSDDEFGGFIVFFCSWFIGLTLPMLLALVLLFSTIKKSDRPTDPPVSVQQKT